MSESDVLPLVDVPLLLSMVESELDSIRVRVLLTGIKKEELHVSGKIMKIRGMIVPMSRFGAWIYQTLGNEAEVASGISRLGGPTAAFVYALHKTYPEISAWMCDESNCSFNLEFEKGQKMRILDEIGNRKMQENMQKYLTELGFTLKMIIIVREKKTEQALNEELNSTAASQTTSPKLKPKSKKNSTRGSEKNTGPVQISAVTSLKYRKLKSEIKETKDNKEKLKQLAEFAICSMEIGKFHEDVGVVEEIKPLMSLVQASQNDIQLILKNISNISQFLKDGDPVGSIDLILASSNLVKQIKKTEDRIDSINDGLGRIFDTITKIFKLKSTSIDVVVGVEDELGRPRPETGSGTAFAKANKEQQRGKRAFKKYNYDEALRFYDAAIKFEPKRMLYHLDKAEVYLAKGNFEECRNECTAVLESDDIAKYKARAKEILGEVELRSYNVLQAINRFKESFQISSSQDALDKLSKLDQFAQQVLFGASMQALGRLSVSLGGAQAQQNTNSVPNPSGSRPGA